MKLKDNFFYTLREDVKDEDSRSGNLLVRSGMMKKVGAGIYMYMPLGLKVLHKIEAIVREEMNKAGANELLMPSLLPMEVYEASGRKEIFGDSMFKLEDRFKRPYALGPTHEELFVSAASMKIRSYKDMPFNLYQIGAKYRDEARPRFGLIRVREFFMKDAYSFDRDLVGLDVSYQKMYQAYQNIFDRIGLNYRIVRADTGAMGGLLSEEFQAVTEIGEDTLVLCEHCDYASNIEVSACVKQEEEKEEPKEKELILTENVKTIEEVASFLQIDPSKLVKTLIYQAKDQLIAVMIRGDREVNSLKVAKYLGILEEELELASSTSVEQVSAGGIGFVGPIDLSIPIYADQDIQSMHNFVVGANRPNYHWKNVNPSDYEATYLDLKNVEVGDACPKCGHPLIFKKGIEVGNTFKLGDKYSKSLNLTYLDESNQSNFVQMGCYGIGIGRVLAALAEQKSDSLGLSFPWEVAPYQVNIILINDQEEAQVNLANQLYDTLKEMGIDVLLDDRSTRPGVKFNDNDLIGIPVRITVGKLAVNGQVEYKLREEEEAKILSLEEAIEQIKSLS